MGRFLIIPTGPHTSDIELLSRLQSLTNIVPLLARADELDPTSLTDVKCQLREDLDDEDIEIFSFSGVDQSSECLDVFSVSSATRRDDEVFDASVLMSSSYMDPLIQSDLGKLVNCVFSLEGASQLRYSAALKAVNWVRQNRHRAASSALVRHSYSTGASAVTVDPFFQMRDWRRLEVSSWAQNLRQSLDYERVLNATGQALLSTELSPKQSQAMARRHGSSTSRKRRRTVQPYSQDPLGLIELVGHLKSSGTLAVELLSGIGVIGYLAMCIIKPDSADRNIGMLSQWCLAIA